MDTFLPFITIGIDPMTHLSFTAFSYFSFHLFMHCSKYLKLFHFLQFFPPKRTTYLFTSGTLKSPHLISTFQKVSPYFSKHSLSASFSYIHYKIHSPLSEIPLQSANNRVSSANRNVTTAHGCLTNIWLVL